MTPCQQRALEILAGCPDGATLDTLRLNGVDHKTLFALLEANLIRVEQQTLRTGLKVWRFRSQP